MYWRAPERFRAFRLLGIHPSDALFTSELTSLLQACETLDPGAGSLVAEVWNEVVSAEALPALIETYERESRHSRAWNETAARQYLLRVVETAIMRVDAKEKYHAFRAEVERDLAEPLSCFDESREGSLLRRYEETCGRDILKSIAELRACQAEGQTRHANDRRVFCTPVVELVARDGVLSETAAQADLDGSADFYGDDDATRRPIWRGGCVFQHIGRAAKRSQSDRFRDRGIGKLARGRCAKRTQCGS